MPKAIAIIEYRVIEGGVDSFLALVQGETFQNALKSYPGFVSYSLVKIDHQTWCEYVHWESIEAAHEGARLFQINPANNVIVPYLDSTSFNVQFLQLEIFVKAN